ncbi:hypothetical protein Tco_1576274 [Tanacetum coccineum]
MKCCEMMYDMGDLTGVSVSLGGEIFSGKKKCRKSNIGDSDNTRDGGKIVGGAIGACGGIGTPLMLDSYTSDMCMQSWGISSYARAMIELRADMELKDNIVAVMPKINEGGYYTCNIHVEYEWKPPRCVCCKMEFKPKQVYQPVSKKTAANTSANKKKNVDPPKESSSPSTTPTIEKINKMENLIIDGKAILVNNEGKPLRKVDEDSEDDVASDDNEMASFLAKKDGYGTQSLLEQWKDSHELDDYEYNHTMICMKARKFLKCFKLFVII